LRPLQAPYGFSASRSRLRAARSGNALRSPRTATRFGRLSPPLPRWPTHGAGVSASSRSGRGGAAPRHPCDLRAALDALQPTASTTLLSALEATERLREIVEGFFFRRPDDEGRLLGRHVLMKSPPGFGRDEAGDGVGPPAGFEQHPPAKRRVVVIPPSRPPCAARRKK
jgi:hypothetical protein